MELLNPLLDTNRGWVFYLYTSSNDGTRRQLLHCWSKVRDGAQGERKEGRKEVGSYTTQQVQEGNEERTCKCQCSQITTMLLLLLL